MQEIADRAQINKALLHYHFRDKEGLYKAAVQSIVDEVIPKVAGLFIPDAKPRQPEMLIRELVRVYVTVLQKNPELVGMALRELSDGGTYLGSLLQGMEPLLKQITSGIFGIMEGQRGLMSFQHMMINLMGMVWGSFFLQPMYTKMLPAAGFDLILDEKFYEERIRCIADMVILSVGLEGSHSV